MAKLHPYLQRRGGRWFFRISVPADLRQAVGAREICRALGTGERRVAVPMALQFGAAATTVFHHLRDPMSKRPDPVMMATLRLAHVSARRMIEREEAEERLEAEQEQGRAQLAQMRREQNELIARLQREHEHALKLQAVTVERDGVMTALRTLQAPPAVDMQARPAPVAERAPEAAHATVGAYIDEYLASYDKVENPEMFKKIVPALELVRELLGSKPVTRLVQRDLESVFDVVRRLPPKWQATCTRRGLSATELAKEDHPTLLGGKTWQDNYVVPVRLFLDWARTSRHDEGFPVGLNVRSIKLNRKDNTGEKKQRAFRADELERLFHGPELQAFKADPGQAHKWWLPVLAFYSGARVNELCQLNPQVDILTDSASDIDYLVISEKTEADPRIDKSVKTGEARVVPLHPELIASGFLDYVKANREAGHKVLFPAWKPINKRASTQAEKWFSALLRKTGLRDETPGSYLSGMHAFRHTLLTLAANSDPEVDAGAITGHAGNTKGGAQRGYEVKHLPSRLRTLQAIQFGFKP